MSGFAEYCYFIPPQGWELADQSKLMPRVKICFLGKSFKPLLPSVNLATEQVDISLKTYIDIVKRDCEKDPNSRWRDLGKYQTPLGEGRLTQRTLQTEFGVCRQVQLIVIKEQTAYILTCAALQDEFSQHYKTFESVLRSLTVTPDLVASFSNVAKRASLKNMIDKLQSDWSTKENASFEKLWTPFQNKIINDFTEMGPYWQILLLYHVRAEIELLDSARQSPFDKVAVSPKTQFVPDHGISNLNLQH